MARLALAFAADDPRILAVAHTAIHLAELLPGETLTFAEVQQQVHELDVRLEALAGPPAAITEPQTGPTVSVPDPGPAPNLPPHSKPAPERPVEPVSRNVFSAGPDTRPATALDLLYDEVEADATLDRYDNVLALFADAFALAKMRFEMGSKPPGLDRLLEIGKKKNIYFWMTRPEFFQKNLAEVVPPLALAYAQVRLALLELRAEPDVFIYNPWERAALLAVGRDAISRATRLTGDKDYKKEVLTGIKSWILDTREQWQAEVLPPEQSGEQLATLDVQAAFAAVRASRASRIARASSQDRFDQTCAQIKAATIDPIEAWRILGECVDVLAASGQKPNVRTISRPLSLVLHTLPDGIEPSAALAQAISSAQLRLDQDQSVRDDMDGIEAPTPEVSAVRDLLAGRAMVLIGGDRRPHLERNLTEAFGLSDLVWIATNVHESHRTFEADIARADVACVCLAIRWCSHSYGSVKEFCTKHGKPLVRLPGGLNPNTVAAQITAQVSGRL